MRLIIDGPQEINGEVNVSGAKNSATRILAAAMLSSEKVVLRNFPLSLEDAKAKISFMRQLGVITSAIEHESMLEVIVPTLSYAQVESYSVPIRTTYLLAAGSLARLGVAKVPYPGGCRIGSRGYDLHIMAWQKLGCTVEEKEEYIEVRGELRGALIDFPISTVGGTENALLCACVAAGETIIRNAYVTPEVNDLIRFLREMGAKIDLEGNSLIRVNGRSGLLKGATYTIMPDRIEALTWITLGAVTGGQLLIRNVPFETMEVPLIHLREAGLNLFSNEQSIVVGLECLDSHGLQPFEVACGTHPGVISDMQAFFVFLALFANGRSTIFDYRYPERTAYAQQLSKFYGNRIETSPGKIIVHGSGKLSAADVSSTDLRGSMALIMAAICADGCSSVDGVELALRGYNNLPSKLEKLGVKCEWLVD